jgi:hypothetical protein
MAFIVDNPWEMVIHSFVVIILMCKEFPFFLKDVILLAVKPCMGTNE